MLKLLKISYMKDIVLRAKLKIIRLLFCVLVLYFTGANSENARETKFLELKNKLNDLEKLTSILSSKFKKTEIDLEETKFKLRHSENVIGALKEENLEMKAILRAVNGKLKTVDNLVHGSNSEQPFSSTQDALIKVSEEQLHLNNDGIESKC